MTHPAPAWDTDIGGGQRRFPSTCWSKVLGGSDLRASVNELSKHYWKPIYAYIRVKWNKSNEEAKDLTQDFFIWMMESDFIGRADPRRGRFRGFVKTALEHYLIDEGRKEGRQKRGGDRAMFALEGATDEKTIQIPDPKGRTPEQVMDETWKREILSRATALLEEALGREGKAVYFRIFEEFHLSGSDKVTYRDVAAKHGVTEKDVSNYLGYAKKRFGSYVWELAAETVGSVEDLQDELRELFGGAFP